MDRIREYYLPLFLLLLCTSPVLYAEFPIRVRQIQSVPYVYLQDVAAYYGLSIQRFGTQFKLRSKDNKPIDFNLSKRLLDINGVKIDLSFMPKKISNIEFLAERDLALVLDPILRDWSLPEQRLHSIVIDPGHGGKDRGTIHNGIYEKDINLALAKQLKVRLEDKGYTVHLTRSDDRFVHLVQRTEFAKANKGDLFISLHGNHSSSSLSSGIESFVISSYGTVPTYKNTIQTQRFPGNYYDPLNLRLAYEIQWHLIFATKARDRGIKRTNFQVLRQASCPAVLVEVGFLSNPNELRLLLTQDYQRMIVKAIVRGVISYHHVLEEGSTHRRSMGINH